MLANGATLGYKASSSGTSYTDLPGLKQIPDMGVDPEKVENTCLTDSVKQYELGIGDAGDIEYVFKYDNSSATAPYRVLRTFEESKATVYFKEEDSDGTTFEFGGQVSVKRNGGGVNDPVEFTLAIALQTSITVTDPS